MAIVEDIDYHDSVTLADGDSLDSGSSDDRLTVKTKWADTINVFIDDGTTGNTPSSYDITHDVKKPGGFEEWMRDTEETGSTDNKHRLDASEKEWRVNITNQSGAEATYRIFVESRQEKSYR